MTCTIGRVCSDLQEVRARRRFAAVCLASVVLSLTACHGGDSGPEEEAPPAPALQPSDSAAARASGSGDVDLAGALLGGFAAVMTGTGECLQLTSDARGSGAAADAAAVTEDAGIPIEAGLTVTYAVARANRDTEAFVEVTSTDEHGFDLRMNWPEDRMTARRRVLWEDLAAAGCLAVNYTGEPSVGGPGLTWLSLSRALLSKLRAGAMVEFGLANESLPQTKRFVTYVGALRPVRAGSFTLTLDDSLVQVPTIVTHAELRSGDVARQFEFEFLDDPVLPLLLRACCERSADHVVRIERPRKHRIEQALAELGQAIVYGIQFDFASAILRDDAAPVLEEIAEALRAHPDWQLRVEGHTDGIGDGDANLELSRNRARAVKEALVHRLGSEAAERLDARGYGESRPRAGNDSLEGRAANRRVELSRSRSEARTDARERSDGY